MDPWKPIPRHWFVGPKIYSINGKFVVARCKKANLQGGATFALKAALDVRYNALIEMEREVLLMFPPNQSFVVQFPRQDGSYRVKYTGQAAFAGRAAAGDNYALLFPKPKKTAYTWFRYWHLKTGKAPPASVLTTLLRSALEGLHYLHDQGISLRKLQLSDLEIVGTTELRVRYLNFENACVMPHSPHFHKLSEDKKIRWIERQKSRDFDVRFTSPELARDILDSLKSTEEIRQIDSKILITSDIFLLGMAFYFGITMMSVYSVIFPPEQVVTATDLDRIINDYRGLISSFSDTLPIQVVKTMLSYAPSMRADTKFLLEYINTPIVELTTTLPDSDFPMVFPEITED
jgi:serine/threonine protein kinase